MKSVYKYYIEIIKPVEKKYTRMCTLYSIFKWKCFKIKMNYYNHILVNYYKMLQNNHKTLEELDIYINK